MKFRLPGLLVVFSLALVLLPAAPAAEKITPDVVYGHKHGLALTFDVFQPAEKANGAGVLFMVSGGWRSRWSPPERAVGRFQDLLDKGFTVFAVRHGSSPKYDIPEIVEDVRLSVRFIRLHAADYGVEADRLGVFGGSAGGHLSLVLGTTSDKGNEGASSKVAQTSNRVAAVVAYFPPTDLRNIVPTPPAENARFPALNFDPEKAADYSPIVHVSEDDPPTLLVHGDKDNLVPLSNSTKMLSAMEGKKVTSKLLVLEGAGHGFRGEQGKQASEAMVAWFVEHLAGKQLEGTQK
ncbi:MAG: alpha/beta hydrolase [Pirellulaceae bacterium]